LVDSDRALLGDLKRKPMSPILRIRDIHKRFGGEPEVLQGIDLDVDEGEIASLLGPSGCGKTTLLRIIAGLEEPDRGTVYFEGQDVSSIPVHKRGFGLMFQDYALFPHRDVTANVAFGLRMQGRSPHAIRQRVEEMLALVNLEQLAHRDVNLLSGGEQQRVALARALAPQPRLLMLDEPIGALDRTLRDRLLEELRSILKQVDVTVLYVTHDQTEAFAVADRVILMRQGQIVQSAPPEAVYRRPASVWVARFLGMRNLLEGTWVRPGVVETAIGPLEVEPCGDGPTTVLIRPEAATLDNSAVGSHLECTLVRCSFRGALSHIEVQCAPGVLLAFELPAHVALPGVGETMRMTIRRDAIVCLDR
jgi:ABC-type Fe3+/spermidine/putrescine transport system ATPase subunit